MSSSDRSEDWAIDRAPTRNEYETMLRGVENNLEGGMKIQCKFVLVTLGELGLRAGELAHITQQEEVHGHNWIDFENEVIDIPGPGVSLCDCGYCKDQAEQEANQQDITVKEAMKNRWKPHRESAVRNVPFGYKPEILDLYKQFFDWYDGWPRSRVTVNRRVKRAVENSDINRDPNSINPQTLRVTAAKYHANNGMSPQHLADLMGWASAETSLRYYSHNYGLKSEFSRIY